MLVLHGGCYLPDRKKEDGTGFFVWGEEMPDEFVGTRRRGRRPKPDLHPFAAEPGLLGDGLLRLTAPAGEEETVSPPERAGHGVREWGVDPDDVGYPVRVLYLELPSAGGWPLPSPLLPVAAEEEGREVTEVKLVPWLVKGLVLAPAEAAGLLLTLGRPGRSFPADLLPGSDLLYWAKVAGFTQEMLVRQRFLPVVGEDLRAGWRIVPGPEEAGRLNLLAAAMPTACRALKTQVRDEAAEALQLVESFIQSAGSGRIRSYLAAAHRERPTSGGYPRRRELAGLIGGLAHERWLAAVVAGQSEINVPTEQLKSLAARLEEWARPLVSPVAGAGLKTCFRLSPPAEDGPPDQWRLSFFLQAVDDPSILVPAEAVWREKKSTLTVLERRFEDPQERLLTDLGVACRLFPPLEAGLSTSRPAWCALSVGEAYQFLKHAAGLFEESGLGVQVPAFWRERGRAENAVGARLKIKVHEDRQDWSAGVGRGLLGLDTLVDFYWELALGGETLSVEEYRQLSRLKAPLVNVRGQWVELDPAEIEQTLRLLGRRKQGTHTLRDALKAAGGYGDRLRTGLPVQVVEAGGELGSLLEQLRDTGKIALLPPPEGFVGQLRPYQVRGFSWLKFLEEWRLGACLADDMGLGKTVQALALLLHRVERECKGGPVLLVCPTSVVGNWEREAARFAPGLSVLVHHGPGRSAEDEFAALTADRHLVITSYAIVHRDIDKMLAVDWAGIILDEAQNIKNPGAARTRSIKRLAAGFRLALTGTPVENRLSELWSILDFANPGLLGSANEFREKFALPIERYGDQHKAQKLKEIVQPFILRRLKTDPHIIADLPEKQESKVYCSLTREQVTLYAAVVQDMMDRIAEAEGIERRGLVLAAMTKLKQVCNHPAQFQRDGNYAAGRSGKLARLTEMTEELLASGQAALIFTQFAQMGEILRRHLQSHFGQEIPFLHGALPQRARDRLVDRFQAQGGPPVLILSLRAGGVGLNLTRANHVFHFDRWWNPAVEDQATDRAYRIGQKQNVFVYKFICSGTLEERIDELMEEKRQLTNSVIGAGEDWLTGLSTTELRKLFALGAGVSVED
ncbi:MAG TPA: DEAD/DEAH box helicase [Spirochaetia bacterium]|nr:DEAD/DEAH box helicase [Spirochaetia bacterium]